MSKKLELFLSFLKIGTFTFGGGYAMVPLIQNEVIEKKKWINEEEMMDIIAIAESTPGPIAINSATFVGYRVAGFWGSFFATLGVVLPSILIITIIALFFERFLEIEIVAAAFKGIRAGVAVLILNAALRMYKKFNKGIIGYALMIIALVLSFFVKFRFMSLILILLGAVIGILVQTSKKIDKGEEQ
jgi:chromate transporter